MYVDVSQKVKLYCCLNAKVELKLSLCLIAYCSVKIYPWV